MLTRLCHPLTSCLAWPSVYCSDENATNITKIKCTRTFTVLFPNVEFESIIKLEMAGLMGLLRVAESPAALQQIASTCCTQWRSFAARALQGSRCACLTCQFLPALFFNRIKTPPSTFLLCSADAPLAARISQQPQQQEQLASAAATSSSGSTSGLLGCSQQALQQRSMAYAYARKPESNNYMYQQHAKEFAFGREGGLTEFLIKTVPKFITMATHGHSMCVCVTVRANSF